MKMHALISQVRSTCLSSAGTGVLLHQTWTEQLSIVAGAISIAGAYDSRRAKASTPQKPIAPAPPVSHQQRRQGVPSLESICLGETMTRLSSLCMRNLGVTCTLLCIAGVLAEQLDAVLAAGADLISSFPWQWKAALLAVARRSVRMHLPPALAVSVQPLSFASVDPL